jgi:hypothetical protein
VEQVGNSLGKESVYFNCVIEEGPRIKERGKFLKYFFREHPQCYTGGQAIRIPLS